MLEAETDMAPLQLPLLHKHEKASGLLQWYRGSFIKSSEDKPKEDDG